MASRVKARSKAKLGAKGAKGSKASKKASKAVAKKIGTGQKMVGTPPRAKAMKAKKRPAAKGAKQSQSGSP